MYIIYLSVVARLGGGVPLKGVDIGLLIEPPLGIIPMETPLPPTNEQNNNFSYFYQLNILKYTHTCSSWCTTSSCRHHMRRHMS